MTPGTENEMTADRSNDGANTPAGADGTANGSDDSPIRFPVDFPIKVIGRDRPGFRDAVLDILDAHFTGVTREHVTTRPSRGGTYLAITTTVRAESREQLDGAYRALSAHTEVVWAL
jgi:putative lipoic acid-binding regulatory protein